MDLRNIFNFIPEVRKPSEKKVDFNTKLKWTLIIIVAFFVLANIPLFGLSNNALERFEYLAVILGTDFGSIISLGIGPIVMASIILQLLTGAGIITIDTNTVEGKKFFQGIQKILVFFFILFEAMVYVLMQGLQAMPGFTYIVIIQLILGGIAIFYMDEVCQKWGFGSGVSLFIAAGVSWRIFTQAFQVIGTSAQGKASMCLIDSSVACSGKVWVMISSIAGPIKDTLNFYSAGAALLMTVIIFLIVVWAQSLKVEIPLSFGRIRGYGIKWPLSFFYASVIPVILTAALVANLQLFGGLFENAAQPCYVDGILNRAAEGCAGGAKIASYFGWTGHFVNGQAVSGFAFWIGSTNIVELLIRGGMRGIFIIQSLTHILFFVVFSTLFSVFWVKTAGMDAKSQAQKITASGLQVSGFRQDNRVLESILERYVMPLTIMGGAAVGLLSSVSDLFGALVAGTSFLLVIMIFFQMYQSIAQQHAQDMNPAMRKFMGSG